MKRLLNHCEARKGRHRLADGDSRGRSVAHRAEPRQGRHTAREIPMSPLIAGLAKRGSIIPALFALGHIMATLTGLADADTDTLAYL
jgi:hypothetical protein